MEIKEILRLSGITKVELAKFLGKTKQDISYRLTKGIEEKELLDAIFKITQERVNNLRPFIPKLEQIIGNRDIVVTTNQNKNGTSKGILKEYKVLIENLNRIITEKDNLVKELKSIIETLKKINN
jgi:flagellar biosynthesis chaperone FliJ